MSSKHSPSCKRQELSPLDEASVSERWIKAHFRLSAKFTFFSSFVLPHITYGDVIWCDKENSTLMDDLQVLQNKAARIILDLRPHAHLLVML